MNENSTLLFASWGKIPSTRAALAPVVTKAKDAKRKKLKKVQSSEGREEISMFKFTKETRRERKEKTFEYFITLFVISNLVQKTEAEEPLQW